jgi:hypothetical protein
MIIQRVRSSGAGVSQICWMHPDPSISASVNVRTSWYNLLLHLKQKVVTNGVAGA